MPIDGDTFRLLGRATAGGFSIVSAYDPSGGRVVALTVSVFCYFVMRPTLTPGPGGRLVYFVLPASMGNP
jgi:hypothetical protein